MVTVPFPQELRSRWADIVAAANDIGGWFDGYSHGYGFGGTDDAPDDGVPSGPPLEVPLFDVRDDEISWSDWPHKDMYAEEREAGGKVKTMEFHFGTYALFRVTREESDILNEGYEDSAGTENERIIEDGDHRIVVYML